MSAQELRQAAETLRGLASMATPGPWEAGERCIWASTLSPNRIEEVVVDGPGGEGGASSVENADYISAMHPGVGIALANWLDIAAQDHEIKFSHASCDQHALLVARLINSGAA